MVPSRARFFLTLPYAFSVRVRQSPWPDHCSCTGLKSAVWLVPDDQHRPGDGGCNRGPCDDARRPPRADRGRLPYAGGNAGSGRQFGSPRRPGAHRQPVLNGTADAERLTASRYRRLRRAPRPQPPHRARREPGPALRAGFAARNRRYPALLHFRRDRSPVRRPGPADTSGYAVLPPQGADGSAITQPPHWIPVVASCCAVGPQGLDT